MRCLLLAVAATLCAAPASTQTLAQSLGGCGTAAPERTINADPGNYRTLLTTLAPGDRLLLAAGTYTQGLPITNRNGLANRCIVIEGPVSGSPALFPGDASRNTINIRDSSYMAIRNLELDGQNIPGVDGVKAEYTGTASSASHHITLENLYIRRHGGDQQTVGISTKCPTWNWVIRRCRIDRAGTGLYLGDSTGNMEFVNGLIEHNLVTDTLGYNMQIKHQNTRSTGIPGMPANGTTIIRHNVFSKAQNASTGADARPNLLVGHWPLSGNGSTDVYQIYGNFFYQNPVEALFQGTGHVAFHHNLLVNDFGPAVNFQFHEGGSNRNVEVFWNTVVSSGRGISITGIEGGYTQRVRGNASFAVLPIQGGAITNNIERAYSAASSSVVNATSLPGSGLDLFPRVGQLTGAAMDTSGLGGFLEWDRDFNGNAQAATFRGAYSGEGTNPGWALALTNKPESLPSVSIGDAADLEGHSGDTLIAFTVTLAPLTAQTVTVDFATQGGTAIAGSDYATRSGTISFAPGQATRHILVRMTGDTGVEPDETFSVVLSNPAGATITDGTGAGTIRNDDPSAAASLVNQYRLYLDFTKEHLYTPDFNEYTVLGTRGWTQEGIAYRLFSNSGTHNGTFVVPFYRLYHRPSQQHHWTTDWNEATVLSGRSDWDYEAIIGYILPTQVSGTTTLFRLVFPNPVVHLWTIDANEDFVLRTQRGWTGEPPAGYVVP